MSGDMISAFLPGAVPEGATAADQDERGDNNDMLQMVRAHEEQLQRYAEDFGVLASDYENLRRDYAAARRNQEKAQEMQQAFEAMVRSLDSYGFIATDTAGEIRNANAAAARLLGANAESLPGRAITDFFDDIGCAAMKQEMSCIAINAPRAGDSLVCGLRAAGTGALRMRAMRVPQLDPPGFRVNWLLRRPEKLNGEASVNNEIFSAIFSNAAHAVMVTDREGRIISVNAAFCSVTGYDEAEVLGQTPRILASDRHDSAFFGSMWHALSAQGDWQGEIWNRRKNGEVRQEWLHITTSRGADGDLSCYVAMFYDIEFARKAHERIYHLAHYDSLTGLPNRTLFNERLAHTLLLCARERRCFSLLFLDLDGFKEINDSLGHEAGDEVLQEFARRLLGSVRSSDTVARLAGDEFVILAHCVSDDAGIQGVANKILSSLKDPVRAGGHDLYLGVSIGVACYPAHGEDASSLLSNADATMYIAKRAGGNTFRVYSEAFTRECVERLSLISALRQALTLQQLSLVYQPQVDCASGQITGVEALLRWQLPGVGEISPAQFIPLAEEIGLIVPIGFWVLETACAQQVAWKRAGLRVPRVSVNVAARQLNESDFVARVETIMMRTGIDPRHLEIEVTESQLMESVADSVERLRQLRSLGISIAVDDFGTGYSSLGRLHCMPIDRLKIDRTFVQSLGNRNNGDVIAKTILAMAQSLCLTTVAEGVETQTQFHRLRELNCSEMQGFLFARPLHAEAVEDLLSRHTVIGLMQN